jgi:hypothetical protein
MPTSIVLFTGTSENPHKFMAIRPIRIKNAFFFIGLNFKDVFDFGLAQSNTNVI